MLINSSDIKIAKEHLEIMQAFVDGEEIEFTSPDKGERKQAISPLWDFTSYLYRIKPSETEYVYPIYKQSKEYGTIVKFTGLDSGEYMTKTSSFNAGDYNNNLVKHTDNTFWKDYTPEYAYPIYKRLKETPETVVKFTSLDAGIYISTHDSSIYKPGDAALNMAPHTDSSWEDAPRRIMDIVRDSSGKIVDLVDRPLEPENVNTIELFEVMIYWDTAEDFKINGTLYSNEELKQLKHYQKTGRSFIIDEDTRQIIKVVNQ